MRPPGSSKTDDNCETNHDRWELKWLSELTQNHVKSHFLWSCKHLSHSLTALGLTYKRKGYICFIMSFRYLDVHKTLAIINGFYHSAIKCIVCKISFLDDFVRKKKVKMNVKSNCRCLHLIKFRVSSKTSHCSLLPIISLSNPGNTSTWWETNSTHISLSNQLVCFSETNQKAISHRMKTSQQGQTNHKLRLGLEFWIKEKGEVFLPKKTD